MCYVHLKDPMLSALYFGMQRGLDFFLHDRNDFFKRRNIMFESHVAHPTGGTTKCLVYPDGTGKLGIIYPEQVMWPTHQVCVDGIHREARMAVVVKNENGNHYSVDPFHFKWNSGKQV